MCMLYLTFKSHIHQLRNPIHHNIITSITALKEENMFNVAFIDLIICAFSIAYLQTR